MHTVSWTMFGFALLACKQIGYYASLIRGSHVGEFPLHHPSSLQIDRQMRSKIHLLRRPPCRRRHFLGRPPRASPNSPSSIPSPTYQCTKALLAYIRSNLWSSLAQASAMAVVLESIQTALWTLARSPPGTTVGGW